MLLATKLTSQRPTKINALQVNTYLTVEVDLYEVAYTKGTSYVRDFSPCQCCYQHILSEFITKQYFLKV